MTEPGVYCRMSIAETASGRVPFYSPRGGNNKKQKASKTPRVQSRASVPRDEA